MKKQVILNQDQLRLMECLWERPQSIPELVDSLDWSDTAIVAMVHDMEEKSLICFKFQEGARICIPAVRREDVTTDDAAQLMAQARSFSNTPSPCKTKRYPLHVIAIIFSATLIVTAVILCIFLSRSSQDDTTHSKLSQEAVEKAVKQCQQSLRDSDYSQVIELYKTMDSYPDAVEQLDQTVSKHILYILDKDAVETVTLCRAFQNDEKLFAVVLESIKAYITPKQDDRHAQILYFHSALASEALYIDCLDQYIYEYFLQILEDDQHHPDFQFLERLQHNAAIVAQIHTAIEQKMNRLLQQKQYDYVQHLYSDSHIWNVELKRISQMIHDHAYALMEAGAYTDAKQLFYQLRDCKDPLYDLDAQYMARLATLHIYLLDNQFHAAKEWVNTFTGETKEKLMEVFLTYSADRKIVADIESAILAQMALAEAGATAKEQLDTQLSHLRKYRNLGFYDDTLKELVMRYLDAITEQRDALFYDQNGRDYYKYYYHWHMETAKQYQILDVLHRDYGFASDNTQLQSLLGIGEGIEQWITAWYEIHNCLSEQLWDRYPYQDGNQFCLNVRNTTDYTFLLTIRVRATQADGTLLSEYTTEQFTMTPGMEFQLPLGDADQIVYNWIIDWEILDIR